MTAVAAGSEHTALVAGTPLRWQWDQNIGGGGVGFGVEFPTRVRLVGHVPLSESRMQTYFWAFFES